MNSGFKQTLTYWRHGVRLYIAFAIVIVTLEGWWWASTNYGGSNLVAIRSEELYAWLSLSLLATAISIGPFYKIFSNAAGKSLMFDARRLFGVGAAWFATLHVVLVYSSLFKWTNPFNLPNEYQRSFIFGIVALIILLSMAFTSFDPAMRRLGVWWFRLHRFVYVAVLFVLLHTFMIGTHAVDTNVLILLSLFSTAIFGLEIGSIVSKRRRPTKWQIMALIPSLAFLIATFSYAYMKHGNKSDSGNKQGQVQTV